MSELNDEAPSEQVPEPYPSEIAQGSSARGRLPWLIIFIVGKCLSLLLQLYVVRQYQKILGEDGYGAYAFVFFLGSYMTLIDPGCSGAFLRQLAALHPERDMADRIRIQRCHVFLIYVITAIVLASVIGLSFVLTIPQAPYSRAEQQHIFLSLAFFLPWGILTMIPNVVFDSRESFKVQSFFSILYIIACPIFCLIGVRLYHSPSMIFYGLGTAGMVMFIFQSIQASREFGRSVLVPKWDRKAYADAKGLVLRDMPNRYTSLVANNIDKVLVGFKAGVAQTGLLTYSARLPEALTEAMNPLIGVVAPQLYRESENDPNKFARTAASYFRLNVALGVSLILVPCCAGSAFLQVWLGTPQARLGGAIMLGMALYRVAMFFISSFSGALFALGKPHWAFPLNLTNAVATAGLTVPAVMLGGLMGIGFMNAGIGVVLIGIATYISKRVLPKQFELRDTFSRILGMLVLGVTVSLTGYWINNHTVVQDHPFMAMGLAGALSILTMGAIFSLRLAELPASISERIRARRR